MQTDTKVTRLLGAALAVAFVGLLLVQAVLAFTHTASPEGLTNVTVGVSGAVLALVTTHSSGSDGAEKVLSAMDGTLTSLAPVVQVADPALSHSLADLHDKVDQVLGHAEATAQNVEDIHGFTQQATPIEPPALDHLDHEPPAGQDGPSDLDVPLVPVKVNPTLPVLTDPIHSQSILLSTGDMVDDLKTDVTA